MRLVAEGFTIVAGALAIFSFAWNRLVLRPARRRSNLDHARELERENEELDAILSNINRTPNKGK